MKKRKSSAFRFFLKAISCAVKDKKNFSEFLFSAFAIPTGLGGQAKVANKTKAKIFWRFFFRVVREGMSFVNGAS